MRERSAVVVVRAEAFYEDTAIVWQEAFDEASADMVEPLQIKSSLEFCENVDEDGRPSGPTRPQRAKYACCAVTVKDLSESAEAYDWEPLCNQRRPKVVRVIA